MYRQSARRWLSHPPAVGCHYYPPGLWSLSQPKNVTVLRPVPYYTAWWQRHTGVNNLPKVASCYAVLPGKSNALSPNHCATVPFRYKLQTVGLFNNLSMRTKHSRNASTQSGYKSFGRSNWNENTKSKCTYTVGFLVSWPVSVYVCIALYSHVTRNLPAKCSYYALQTWYIDGGPKSGPAQYISVYI